jgi:hypothetical protein
MNRPPAIFLLGLIALALTACTGLADSQIQDLAPATETPSPTPTFVWFPPSATPTPQVFPTKAPTPERKPGVGKILLSDDFSSPSLWNTAVSDEASIDVSRNRLTIAVGSGVYALSLRQDVTFGDFYAEVTARPSLCRGQDDYGMLVRAIPAAAYRFALACDGTARVDRASVRSRTPLQAPVPSGDVPPGAPGEVRLGVWAVGTELRFFLNGRYQFSVNDKSYASGAIGVFAHSTGDTPVTVTFSDLVVYDVSYSPPTRTPSP